MYDEFLKRDYEVVPVSTFHNGMPERAPLNYAITRVLIELVHSRSVPDEVREIMMNRYSFLVCEKEALAEYTGPYQSCGVCTAWASPTESVRCRQV